MHLALQIRVHSRNAPCVSGSPRRHDPRPASHRAGQRQGVGIPHKVNTANLAWSTGTPASLHQHQYGRAQRQLQWRYCQGESEAFLSPLLEIHIVTYFCFVFCFIFILSAWQPSRLKCWCHDCPHVAPHGLSGLRLASTTGPHIHKSSTTPNACHVKRLGSYKRFPQPLEPSPLVKPFATQCETFSVSLLLSCFS